MVSKVTREDLSEAVNAVLDSVANNLSAHPDYQREMYKMTLDVLRSNNERLWFTICLRLGKIYQDLKNFELLDSLLSELKESCRTSSNTYDNSKANLLLEVFALEIQMCSMTKNNARMKAVYLETQKLSSVINDPRVVAIIKETGGKIFMGEKKWHDALNEMFESFKNYQEIGNTRAKTVLKYVILASILSASEIDYANTREAKVYTDDPQIQAIVLLRKAYEKNDINTIQQILSNKNS
jgi:COP9 signalosome complex subunit 2